MRACMQWMDRQSSTEAVLRATAVMATSFLLQDWSLTDCGFFIHSVEGEITMAATIHPHARKHARTQNWARRRRQNFTGSRGWWCSPSIHPSIHPSIPPSLCPCLCPCPPIVSGYPPPPCPAPTIGRASAARRERRATPRKAAPQAQEGACARADRGT